MSEQSIGQLATVHGVMAFFGAVTHALRAHRDGKSKGWLDFVVLTIMSSFSGVVFALVAMQISTNIYFTLAATGAGGFLGVEGLALLTANLRDVIANAIKKKIP